jgi:hypothetical protein
LSLAFSVRIGEHPPRRSALLADIVTRKMRSEVTLTGGTLQTESALAIRESSLVGERVEAVVRG